MALEKTLDSTLTETKTNSDILAYLKECLEYAKSKKEILKNMTSMYFKKGDFANYELSKVMFSEKCNYIYETQYLVEKLEEAGDDPGMILALLDKEECDCHK